MTNDDRRRLRTAYFRLSSLVFRPNKGGSYAGYKFGSGRLAGEAARLYLPQLRDLRRAPGRLRLWPAGCRAEEQHHAGLVARQRLRARRYGGPRCGHPDESAGLEIFRPRGDLCRPNGRLPQLQEPLARRPDSRHVPELRLEGSDRAAPVQHDVQDSGRPGRRCRLVRLPAARDSAGHLCQLCECAVDHQPQAAVRYRPDRQGLPQRDQPAQLLVSRARVRYAGDRVLRHAGDGGRLASALAG